MSATLTAPSRPRPRQRPTLRPAPAVRHAPRAPFVIAVLLLLVAGLGTLLLLNTMLAQGSFTLHELQTKVGRLTDREQALQEKASTLAAPQRLARRASALGMVASQNPAFLRAADGKVLGDPVPAIAPPAPTPTVDDTSSASNDSGDTSAANSSNTSGSSAGDNTGNAKNGSGEKANANSGNGKSTDQGGNAGGQANGGGSGNGEGAGR